MRASIVILALLSLWAAPAAVAQEVDQNGVAQSWSGPDSRYTLVDFAASWCRPCWDVLPRVEKFASDHPKVRVLVVSVDDEVKGRDALVERLGLTIPVLWDAKHRIAEHYHPQGMPATFVLDPSGKIVYQHVGSSAKHWNAMVAFLEKATKE